MNLTKFSGPLRIWWMKWQVLLELEDNVKQILPVLESSAKQPASLHFSRDESMCCHHSCPQWRQASYYASIGSRPRPARPDTSLGKESRAFLLSWSVVVVQRRKQWRGCRLSPRRICIYRPHWLRPPMSIWFGTSCSLCTFACLFRQRSGYGGDASRSSTPQGRLCQLHLQWTRTVP